MKAVCWHGKEDVRVDQVPDPEIINPRDAIVRVTSTAICGSDLHLYDGFIPTMEKGDILGHEFMGEVVETGSKVKNLKKGDRVVVPFTIACGGCFFCKRELYSLCDNSNPNAAVAEKMWGHAPAGIYGYSHMVGGYAGGQAEYARVPYADVGPIKVPDHLPDEQVLFLTDIFPTGYMAAENCNIQPGDTIAVWGCGPVGQFAIASALMLGAERVIAIDNVPERLAMAATEGQRRRGQPATGSTIPSSWSTRSTHDRWPRTGCLHRRRRYGSPRHGRRKLLRPRQDQDAYGNRQPQCAAPGDPGLPQGRHRVDAGCLRRYRRQDPGGRDDEQGASRYGRVRPMFSTTSSRCSSGLNSRKSIPAL